MTTSSQGRSRGRPRDPAKREALVRAARALFLRDGLDAVTMEQIVIESGVARATLYNYFSDKSALLEAVIVLESQNIVSGDWLDGALEMGLEEALLDFGGQLLAYLATPEMMDTERLVEHAARRMPDYGHRFFDAGPGRALAVLVELIEAAYARGEIAGGDACCAAHDLMGLWQGFWRKEVQFGARALPDADEVLRLAEHGVAQFLRIYRS